jgi:hypothetical protein
VQVLLSTPYPLTDLLDERIPQIDGWQLLRLMTAEGRVPPADRHIFMTHAPNLLLPALCSLLRYFAIPVLAKPFSIDQVLRLLQQERETAWLDPRSVLPKGSVTDTARVLTTGAQEPTAGRSNE